MFTKPRYIHQQTPDGQKNGFSVLLTPVDNPNEVGVCVTFCSSKDQYCKRTAREELRSIIPTPVPVLEVPNILAECSLFSRSGKTINELQAEADRKWQEFSQRAYSNHWTWVWKYFL